jgi:hypothetical protein
MELAAAVAASQQSWQQQLAFTSRPPGVRRATIVGPHPQTFTIPDLRPY